MSIGRSLADLLFSFSLNRDVSRMSCLHTLLWDLASVSDSRKSRAPYIQFGSIASSARCPSILPWVVFASV